MCELGQQRVDLGGIFAPKELFTLGRNSVVHIFGREDGQQTDLGGREIPGSRECTIYLGPHGIGASHRGSGVSRQPP